MSRARLGGALVALYPEPWRDRYSEEMRALLEDDPPGARGLASLLAGAARAHVRPQRCWRADLAPATAMRLSVGALFACWMLVSLAGSAFAKLTEHMDPVEHVHPLLSAARGMVTAGAALGAAAVAIGGLPLLWQALSTAVRRRDRRLVGLLASPALAGCLLFALAAVLATAAPSRHGGFPAGFVLGLLVPLALGTCACALVGALAPKAVMRRAEPPLALLRLAAWAGQALTVAIALVALGLSVYVPALWSAVGAGRAPSGPLGLSTGVTLVLALGAALTAVGPALLAAGRARRAAVAAG
ncbi:MAG TPA: hypothetical protein VN618_14440 [Solirubrobacteraceae bacterium]|nr:hypothetical protein [Solirubrobacteraceae bacterium]